MSDDLDVAATLVRDAQRILAVTGAGISADSGLPTYRGFGGLYDDRETEEGLRIEEILSATVFSMRPELTWKYLWMIGTACEGARPNAAHEILARWESPSRAVRVLTQNIDGLHRRAGSSDVLEVHGDLSRWICTGCETRRPGRFGSDPQLPPRCDCGSVIRPEVVLFEERLPGRVLDGLDATARWDPDLVIVVGTTALFPYVQEPIWRAWQSGTPTIEVNPDGSMLSERMTVSVRAGAAEAFSALDDRL